MKTLGRLRYMDMVLRFVDAARLSCCLHDVSINFLLLDLISYTDLHIERA